MIWFLLGCTVTITLVNLLFFLVGYFAAKGSLTEKVKQIFHTRRQEEVSGPVKTLTPEELSKKKSHELYEKYMG